MKNSVARRRAIVWNTLVLQLNDDIDNVKKYAIMARRSKVARERRRISGAERNDGRKYVWVRRLSKALPHQDFDCISPQLIKQKGGRF